MQRSTYLARLIGPIFVAIAFGMLVNAQTYLVMADQALRDYALIYISGLMTLAAGLAIVLAHNVWVGDWRLIITILGWLGVIGGTLRIVWPQLVAQIGSNVLGSYRGMPLIAGIAVLALGGVLSYFGYADEISARRASGVRRTTRKRSRRT